ncbi:MAG: type III polyketide synthase [Actinomycetota bacterium]
MVAAAVAGLGSAFPQRVSQEALWEGFFERHHEGGRGAGLIWRRSGVRFRHGVAIPPGEDLSGWGTEARMERFRQDALPLAREAVGASLRDSAVEPSQVGLLALVTCTGYTAPGIDVQMARELGMGDDVHRLLIGHMGCHAAVPALATVADATSARGLVSVVACVELCSLHLQPPTADLAQVTANALFADAVAAAVVVPEGRGLAFVDVASRTDPSLGSLMTWDLTDKGFRMGLSPELPRALGEHVEAVVGKLLAGHGLMPQDVAAWAVHPGGPRVLDVVADRLRLSDDDLAESTEVLRDRGNCSSATVLLVLERIARDRALSDGDHVVCLTFGPGLTVSAALLTKSD